MSTQGTIRRYYLIFEKVNTPYFPSLEQIKNHLNEAGFKIGLRTLQRDIEHLRDEFGIELLYNTEKRGYYITQKNSINIDSFLHLLELESAAGLLTGCLKESKESLRYMSFSSEGSLKGMEHLKDLLYAIRNHRKISFTYKKFDGDTEKTFILKPYLLKEYLNRWYVIGNLLEYKEFTIFSIDRITNLKVLTTTFIPDTKIKIKERFENIIGITYQDAKAETIVLKFSALQAKYEKALPLHKSQTLLNEDQNFSRFSYTLIPNYELIQKILWLGEGVEVEEPKYLRKEIKSLLKNIARKYKKKK
jgi:predicted DNA-binding transcriptional regulator YafY